MAGWTCFRPTDISSPTSPRSRPARATSNRSSSSGTRAKPAATFTSRSGPRPPDLTSSARSSAGAAPMPISTATATWMSSSWSTTARLFRNDGGNANHWVRLVLKGNGKTSNRDAIGAKVEIKMGDQTCRRQLFPAKSYLSSIEFPLTFGLGNAQKVDELTITWPSGNVTTLTDLKADQIYQVNEESGVAK